LVVRLPEFRGLLALVDLVVLDVCIGREGAVGAEAREGPEAADPGVLMMPSSVQEVGETLEFE
jgi:hypothetical protein